MTAQASATFRGDLPADLIPHLAAHAREAELQAEDSETRLVVTVEQARVTFDRAQALLHVRVEATEPAALQNMRDYLLHLLDHVAPDARLDGMWEGEIARNRAPLNFCTARVVSASRVAPHFLRVEMDCADTRRLAEGKGMHFALLLPPEGRAPVWPRLDDNGRTVMPQGEDALHRAPYTFVDLDAATGRFTFDVFEHEGGRTTGWARQASPGEVVGITGPGSGDFPTGRDILIAGDETALPAIRRILARSAPDRRGRAFVEVGTEADICPLPRPDGIALTWLVRSKGEALWDRLSHADLPEGPDPHVWIAAEKELIRKAKARFGGELGIGRTQSYFAYYWER
jgi:NADPH-dependent ferric siderophore reductase